MHGAARESTTKMTQKGRKFEERAGLEEAARAHSARSTGRAMWRKGRQEQKGRLLATLGGSGKRIAFEMKDIEKVGPAMIRAEIKEASTHRAAVQIHS